MKYFKLPDLGEGLNEAEIVQWLIQEGDEVATDQPLLTVETAKAMIELPSPQAGRVEHLFGQPGDLVHIGEPLLEYHGETDSSATVVGELPGSNQAQPSGEFIIGPAQPFSRSRNARATPAVRALARRLNVDLNQLSGSGPDGHITPADVERAAQMEQQHGKAESLRGVRRHMAVTMSRAHAEVVPVTLTDVVNIVAWPADTDITLRLIQAIAAACHEVPQMNAWFDGEHLQWRQQESIHLGVAVDTEQGLFVPVLRDIGTRTAQDLKQGLSRLRRDVEQRSIPASELQGATFTLSNFGKLGGRFATPVVVPPQIGILAAGATFSHPVDADGKCVMQPHLPLSLTFDHRILSGGEAARFLACTIQNLTRKNA